MATIRIKDSVILKCVFLKNNSPGCSFRNIEVLSKYFMHTDASKNLDRKNGKYNLDLWNQNYVYIKKERNALIVIVKIYA